jgi:membrane-bound lytic murein transglycosylase B
MAAHWIVAVMLLALAVTAVTVGRSLIPRTVPTLAQQPLAPTTTVPPRSSAPAAPSPSIAAAPGPARPADALATWAGKISGATGMPAVAVQAYAYAQLVVRNANPQCAIGWTTLAGIGEVQSHHGQTNGAVLDRTGRSTPPIEGPPLDGRDGRALVSDTDAGAFDSDPIYEHAIGPLMLLRRSGGPTPATRTATRSWTRTTSTTRAWRWRSFCAPAARISPNGRMERGRRPGAGG